MNAKKLCVVVLVAVSMMMSLVFPGVAQAAPTGSWAKWGDWTGSAGNYSGTMTLGTKPKVKASFTTDSLGGSGVGEISGSSAWLADSTPIGRKYGSSRNQPYLNLRPKKNDAGSPSTTTYKFASPTPVGAFAFALGDIDADKVRIEAKDVHGNAVSASQIGFRGTFNYCSSESPGGPSCSNVDDEMPTWDAATMTLTGRADAADRSGASGWFEPTVALSEMTIMFTWRAGFPVYQTWFASMACDINGAVTDANSGSGVSGSTVNLFDSNGRKLDSAKTGSDGSYTFANYTMGTEYEVEVIAPDGKIVEGKHRKTTRLTDCDATTDFTVRDIEPVAVSGHVESQCGTALGDTTVTITGDDGAKHATTTDSEGNYLFDRIDVGKHTLTVTPPEKSTAEAALSRKIEVTSADQKPITGQDFTLEDTDACPDHNGDNAVGPNRSTGGSGSGFGLPVTGSHLLPLILGAAGAILLGLVLVLVARSRRQADET